MKRSKWEELPLKITSQQLKQPRLLFGNYMAEPDTGDMYNGEDNREIAKDIGFIEIALILKTFKEEPSSNFGELTVTMSEMRLKLEDQIKRVHDDVTAVQTSLSNAWLEIESLKTDAEGKKQKIEELDKQVRTLKVEMEAEKQKRIQLDMYSRMGKTEVN